MAGPSAIWHPPSPYNIQLRCLHVRRQANAFWQERVSDKLVTESTTLPLDAIRLSQRGAAPGRSLSVTFGQTISTLRILCHEHREGVRE